MTGSRIFRGIHSLARARIFGRRTPFIVVWNITYRCNQKCEYCGFYKRECKELSTSQVRDYIDELYRCGTRYISFTGGEPLLRDDLEQIISYCKEKDMHVIVNTNGSLLARDYYKIQKADEVQLSFDGPEDIHDRLRAKGSFQKVVNALFICRERGKPASLSCVISRHNEAHADYLVNFAKQKKVPISFHPADNYHGGDSSRKISCQCTAEGWNEFLKKLSVAKKEGNHYIQNSEAGLRYFQSWPGPEPISCFWQKLGCFIEPDGAISVCDNHPDYLDRIVPIKSDFKTTFDSLCTVEKCSSCWCAPLLEFNLLGNFNLQSIIGFSKRWRKRS